MYSVAAGVVSQEVYWDIAENPTRIVRTTV